MRADMATLMPFFVLLYSLSFQLEGFFEILVRHIDKLLSVRCLTIESAMARGQVYVIMPVRFW